MFENIPRQRKTELFEVAKRIKEVEDIYKYTENYEEQMFVAYAIGIIDSIDYLNIKMQNELLRIIFR